MERVWGLKRDRTRDETPVERHENKKQAEPNIKAVNKTITLIKMTLWML